MSKICKNCGAEISDSAIVCMHCNSFCDDDLITIEEETKSEIKEEKTEDLEEIKKEDSSVGEHTESDSVLDSPEIVLEDIDDLFSESAKEEIVEEIPKEIPKETADEKNLDEKNETENEAIAEEAKEENVEEPKKKKEIPIAILIVAAMVLVSLIAVALMITSAFKKKTAIINQAKVEAEEVKAENAAIEEALRLEEEARQAELAAVSENAVEEDKDAKSEETEEEETEDSDEKAKKEAEDKEKKASATIKMTEEEFIYAWYNDKYLEMLPILTGGTPINIISGDDYSCATFEGISGPYAKDYVEGQVKKCGFEIDAVSKEKAADADYVFYANSDDKRTYFVQVDVADKKCHVTVGSAQKSKESN